MGDLCTIMASSTTKFLTPGANPSSLPSTLIAGFETTASPGAPAIIVPERSVICDTVPPLELGLPDVQYG
ncbi:hypothetical protein CVS40_9233 [Lucilia cuprina]|nr:hypothetical protein CVS40_9233 [Lucilia cuprina]